MSDPTKPETPAPATPAAPALAAPAAPEGDKKPNAVVDNLLKAVGLNWIRPLVYKLGGRKMLAGGGGLAVINHIVTSEMGETAKMVACICAALVAIGTSISIAIEDRGKK